MKRYIALVFFAMTVCSGFAFAQQLPAPPTPQEQLDRARLEIAYGERAHKFCRETLADVWARANAMEAQLRQAQDELKALKEKPDAAPQK
mgnify:CR=1 FL=1